MGIYIGQFIYIALLAIMSKCINKKSKKVFFALSCLSILVLTMFRDISIGADTRQYCNIFQFVSQNDLWTSVNRVGWEPGYVLLLKAISIVSDKSQTLIIVMGIIILVPIFKMIMEESSLPCLSLLIFIGMGLWESSTFIYRQWCAMVIVLLVSNKYIIERKCVKFLFSIIVAMLFHRTAVIYIVMYIVYHMKISNKMLIYSVLSSVLIGAIAKPILLPIMNLFARIPERSSYNGGIPMLVFLWISVLVVFFTSKNRLNDKKFRLFFCMILVAAILQPIAFTFSNWARIVNYFSIAIIIILPNVINKVAIEQKNFKVSILIDMMIIGLVLIWYFINGIGNYVFM